MQNNGHYALHAHSMSQISEHIASPYRTSYYCSFWPKCHIR